MQEIFDNFVVMRKLANCTTNYDEMKTLRLLTRTANEVIIRRFQRTNFQPVVEIGTDMQLTSFGNFLNHRIPNLATLQGYHLKATLSSLFDVNAGVTSAMFLTLLETHSGIISGLSLFLNGVMIQSQFQLPVLRQLKVFEILSHVGAPIPPIVPMNSHVLPRVETVIFRGLNFLDEFFDGTQLQTVTSLELDFTYRVHGISFEDPIETMEVVPRVFPNLRSLKLSNWTFKNMERVDFVLTRMSYLEKLTLFTNHSTLATTNDIFETTFTGAVLPQMTRLELINLFRNGTPGIPTIPGRNGTYDAPSLANMKNLRELDITICNITQLRVLIYLSRPNLMNRLRTLTIRLAPENTIKTHFKQDYIRLLRQYHVCVQCHDVPRRSPVPRLFFDDPN